MNLRDLEEQVYGNLDRTCLGVPDDKFFPTEGGTEMAAAAKRICARCPVKDACLDLAIAYDAPGVWGGTSPNERQRLVAERARLRKQREYRPTSQRRARVAELTAQHYSAAEIAEITGMSARSVVRYRTSIRAQSEQVAA